MNGLLSVGNQGLTPEQLKQLQLRQQLMAAKGGVVLPPQAALGQAPAGLLGADPVATQQQSRANPNTPRPKPIYVDSAGNAGRSIPAGSGANVAYGAGQGAKAAGPSLLSRGAGLLGRAALGPAGLGASLMGGGTGLSNSEMPDVPMEFTPEGIADAQKYAQRIQQKSKIPASGAKLLMMGQKPPQAPQAAQGDMAWPDLPVAEPADAPNPNLAAEQALLQTKVKSQLDAGSVSKPKLAKQAVEARLEQSGEKVSKEEKEKLIKEETGFFRSIDDDTVAKYMSAIMTGAGVYSAMMGDSQSAQALFGQANTLRGEKAKKEAEAAAKAAALRKEDREERKVAATERDVDSKAGYRGVQGMTAQERLDIERAELGIAEGRAGVLAGKAESESELARARAERLEAQTSFDEKRLQIEQQRADAYSKAKASGGKGATAPTLTFPQNQELVKSYLKAKGIDADAGVIESTSQQLMNLQKNYPDLTVDEQIALVAEQFEMNPGEESAWWDPTGLTGSDPTLRIPK